MLVVSWSFSIKPCIPRAHAHRMPSIKNQIYAPPCGPTAIQPPPPTVPKYRSGFPAYISRAKTPEKMLLSLLKTSTGAPSHRRASRKNLCNQNYIKFIASVLLATQTHTHTQTHLVCQIFTRRNCFSRQDRLPPLLLLPPQRQSRKELPPNTQ